MTLEEYQKAAVHTKMFAPEIAIPYCALGLTGEAGEVAEKIKKVLRGDKELTDDLKKELVKELGDVLWYVAAMAEELDSSLEEVAQVNINKLSDRAARGVIQGDGDNR